jgi:hypothetical protein
MSSGNIRTSVSAVSPRISLRNSVGLMSACSMRMRSFVRHGGLLSSKCGQNEFRDPRLEHSLQMRGRAITANTDRYGNWSDFFMMSSIRGDPASGGDDMPINARFSTLVPGRMLFVIVPSGTNPNSSTTVMSFANPRFACG